jgi:hypothetical protein
LDPPGFLVGGWEKEAIIDFHQKNPLEGYRRLTFMMLDADVVLVVLHREGRIETFKYRRSELICEACGSDFQTAMIHTTAGGLAPDEPWSIKIEPAN